MQKVGWCVCVCVCVSCWCSKASSSGLLPSAAGREPSTNCQRFQVLPWTTIAIIVVGSSKKALKRNSLEPTTMMVLVVEGHHLTEAPGIPWLEVGIAAPCLKQLKLDVGKLPGARAHACTFAWPPFATSGRRAPPTRNLNET